MDTDRELNTPVHRGACPPDTVKVCEYCGMEDLGDGTHDECEEQNKALAVLKHSKGSK